MMLGFHQMLLRYYLPKRLPIEKLDDCKKAKKENKTKGKIMSMNNYNCLSIMMLLQQCQAEYEAK